MSEKPTAEDPGRFMLSGGDPGFSAKSNDIFASLAALERKHKDVLQEQAKEPKVAGLVKDDPKAGSDDPLAGSDEIAKCSALVSGSSSKSEERNDLKSARDSSCFQGVFRKPQGVPPRRMGGNRGSRVPDHQQNPDHYTHYTLSDVQEMTNRANSAAAFEFLQKNRKKESEDDDDMEGSNEGKKIVFKKPVGKETDSGSKKSVMGGGKVVMPEYVVGVDSNSKKGKIPHTQATEKSDSQSVSTTSTTTTTKFKKGVNLTHFDDEEDDDDEAKLASDKLVLFKKPVKKSHMRSREDDKDELALDPMVPQIGKGTKRSNVDDDVVVDEDEEESAQRIVRRDRAAERRKKSRGRRYVRQQLPEEEEDEEEWKEELERVRREDAEAEERAKKLVEEEEKRNGEKRDEEMKEVEGQEDEIENMIIEGV